MVGDGSNERESAPSGGGQDGFVELFKALREEAKKRRTKYAPSSIAASVVEDALRRKLEIPLDDPDRFQALVRQMIKRKMIDRYRREAAAKRPQQRSEIELSAVSTPLSARLLRLDIGAAMARLAERHPSEAAVVRRYYFDGLNDQEIAAELKQTDDRVRRLRIKGIGVLRRYLGDSLATET